MQGHFLARLAALPITFALAPAPLPIRTPVSAVAASAAGAVALADAEVRVLDATGFPVGRLRAVDTRTPASPWPRSRATDGFATAAGVLADDDYNDPYDADSGIEDPENILVADEPLSRGHARLLAREGGVSLAAGGASAWVGRGDGLWRLPFSGGAERIALPAAGPVRQVASSAGGRVIVAALDDAILRSEDGGARFERFAAAPSRVRRLAVTEDGQAYALAGDAVWRLGGADDGELVARAAGEVAACGKEALALVDRRLLVLGAPTASAEPSREDQVGDDPPVPAGAERLACSPDGAIWVAYGVGLWVSEDRGRSWQARDDLAATLPIVGVAVNGLALWVAGGMGLAVLPLRPPPPVGSAALAWPLSGLDRGGADSPPRWRWWFEALPRVELDLATARSTTRRDVRAFVLLSFTFDCHRQATQAREARQVVAAARAAEQRRAAQRAQLRNAAAPRRQDAIAIEEREAISRLLD